MTLLLTLAALVALWLLSRRFFGFAAQSVADYAGTRPIFDIRQQLSGPILSEGLIFGPTGRVTSRFVAEMRGEWSGNSGTLQESFTFASGGTQERKWHLEMTGDGSFSATADDIVGTGSGEQRDGVVRLRYRIRLPQEAGGHVLDVTDWLYLMENGNIMNRSEMRKFGIKVAELIATMRPVA